MIVGIIQMSVKYRVLVLKARVLGEWYGSGLRIQVQLPRSMVGR